MKTLAYFASGTEEMDFSDFDYDRIILVDNSYKTGSYNLKVENNKTIIKMACDSIEAVEILKEKEIKLDCFIAINEGLFEGGGHYPLNGEYFLAYLSPVLKNIYYHIYAPDYYNNHDFRTLASKNAFRKCSFNRKGEVDFKTAGINPSILNNAGNYNLKCFKMQRKEEETFEISENIKLIYGNIWNHVEELEYLFFPKNSHTDYIAKHNNIHWFAKGEFPFVKLNELLKTLKFSKIGIIPWHSNNYKKELRQLEEFANSNNIEIMMFFQDIRDIKFYKL
jgi:hypothetical protein